jgi:hypothetical protein
VSSDVAPENTIRRLSRRLAAVRLLQPLVESVLPSPRLLKGEEIQLEIHMAGYRRKFAEVAMTISLLLLAIGLLITALAWLLNWPSALLAGMGLFSALMAILVVESVRQMLLHEQWLLLVTNKRLILVTPDPRRRGLADAIYLMRGKIQVVDTNWSRSPWWGLFQAATGARDVLLSLTGYEFKAEGAEVKGGLLFPDVEPENIRRLEELIFG